jgi:AraC family transcriptional regulator, transcriptional activator of pobA
MNVGAIRTFSISEKRFCWNGVGVRTTAGGAESGMAAHRHSFFQIFFVASGTATHEIAGEVTEAASGHIFFVSPYTIHRVTFPRDSVCYVIYFDANFLYKGGILSEASPEDPNSYRVPEMFPFVCQKASGFKLDEQSSSEVRVLCDRLLVACARKDLFDQAEIRADLTLLLVTVARKFVAEVPFPRHDVALETLHNRHVRAALTYIKENFDKPLTLTTVADKVHLSETYLTHLLKSETGKSFKPLLEEFRIENAKNLLSYTDLSLKTIAFRSGFLDQIHFGKRFKALTRTTPAQFRKYRLARESA